MIVSPTASVRPRLELARLTLLSQPVEAVLRRRSTTSGKRPSLGEINGRPVVGPLPPPIPETDAPNADTSHTPPESRMDGLTSNGVEDRSSEETLLGNDPTEEAADQEMPDLIPEESEQQQRKVLEDKENFPPTKAVIGRSATPEHTLKPLAETSPSRTNEQHRPVHADHELPGPHNPKISDEAVIVPPTRPPPCPPRPQEELTKQDVEFGAQQDVTEVISNVLWQTECAIRATSFDAAGEQIDQIKDWFFGKQKSYTGNLHDDWVTKEQSFSTLFVDVASGPKDIYEALDGAFDVQQVEMEGALRPQYSTISHPPPVLNILIQRAQYDQKRSSAFKSTNHLDLRETIYLDRYVDSEDPDLIERRRQSWEWKRVLGQLEARRDDLKQTNVSPRGLVSVIADLRGKQFKMDVPELLAATKDCLDQLSEDDDLGVTADLQETIKQAAVEAKKELDCNEYLPCRLQGHQLTDC